MSIVLPITLCDTSARPALFLYEPCDDCDGFQTVVDVLQADYFVYTPLTQLIYRVIYVYYCIIQPPL